MTVRDSCVTESHASTLVGTKPGPSLGHHLKSWDILFADIMDVLSFA